MGIFKADERAEAKALAALVYTNPFISERIDAEREALGSAFREDNADWNLAYTDPARYGNIDLLIERSIALADRVCGRLRALRSSPTEAELTLYEDVVLFALYHHYRDHFDTAIRHMASGRKHVKIGFYDDFLAMADRYLALPSVRMPQGYDPVHLFASFFQIRRAFHHIFAHIVGASRPAARLRAAVWQSIFSHDLRRYRRVLFRHMSDVTTLITGPSGTGKELVARAIGLSRYIPFNPSTQTFTEDFAGSFFTLNLSALSPTLIESELFGHRRGSFTGAVGDRVGWLEQCPPLGTVFLDEMGEVELSIQVKLLRVLQTRTFQRLGETTDRRFEGKIIAATNRDLVAAMHERLFREDLYYRLCSDLIVTPSLEAQLRDSPHDLPHLIEYLAERMVSEEGPELAKEVLAWVETHLGPDYTWPGNVRELEQCVRNVMIRGEYRPAPRAAAADPRRRISDELLAGELDAEGLLRRYCTLVYARCGTYEETGRRLGLDRRTVKAKVDTGLLAELTDKD